MTFVPKYQWLTEYKASSCGDACDVVQIDTSADKKFQVSFTPTSLLNEDFDGNDIALPMEQIWVGLGSFGSGSGTGLYYGITFDIDTTNDNHFINSFSFFYEGQPYCYVFRRVTLTSDFVDYRITQYGGISLVEYESNFALIPEEYVTAFNFYMNDFGISAIYNGGDNITVYGFPANTQVTTGDAAPYNTIITDGVGAKSINLNNTLPYNNLACYFQISGLSDAIPATGTPGMFTEPITVPANKRMIFSVNYTNNFAFSYVTMNLQVRNSSFVVIDTITVDIEQGTNTVTFNYETGGSSANYYFDFSLEDLAGTIADTQYGFCFNSINIQTIARLSSISVEGCTTSAVTFSEEYNDYYNSLITMDTGSLPNGLITTGKWKLTLTDDEANTWTSITYETIDGTNCLIRNLMRLKWWSDCAFSSIDYAGLPFINDIYVKGYSVSQPLENKERVVNTLSTGEIELIYNYSIEKTEFNIGVYTANFFKTLQRAFEHKYITINGDYYKQDTDSILTKKPEGNKYSAKIELAESGSAVISSKCCCDSSGATTEALNQILSGQATYSGSIEITSDSVLQLQYAKDYVFNGTTAVWTLPSISASRIGRNNVITIKNRGTGAITLNTYGGGNTMYTTLLINSLTINAGDAYIFTPDGTYINVQ